MIWQTEEIYEYNTDIIWPNTTEIISSWQDIEECEANEIEEQTNQDIEEYDTQSDDGLVKLMESDKHWLTDDFLVWKVKEWCSATKITREWDTVEDYPTILENVKLAFKLKGRLTDKPKDLWNTLNINNLYILKKSS